MERPGCSIPDAAETAPVRDPLLYPRSRRPSDRSRANHGPSGGLVACSLVVEYARRGVRVNAEITRRIPHAPAGDVVRSTAALTDHPLRRELTEGGAKAESRFRCFPCCGNLLRLRCPGRASMVPLRLVSTLTCVSPR